MKPCKVVDSESDIFAVNIFLSVQRSTVFVGLRGKVAERQIAALWLFDGVNALGDGVRHENFIRLLEFSKS